MRTSSWLMAFILAGATPAIAHAAHPVLVDITVVKASRAEGRIDEALKKQPKLIKAIENAGFRSAVRTDQLQTEVQVGARVGLEILSKQGPARTLQVQVREVTNPIKDRPRTIKLTVGIAAFKFEIDTEHTDGSTIVVAHRQGKDAALLLAVTPQLKKKK